MSKAMTLSETLTGIIEELDLVSVVRCRVCKHSTERKDWCMRFITPRAIKPDDFCSYGERGDSDDES